VCAVNDVEDPALGALVLYHEPVKELCPDACSCSLTAETALRLLRHFGASADSWMGLQAQYDLEVARSGLGERLMLEVTPRAA
jgi:plasmid maintenance system antidote protein VapI